MRVFQDLPVLLAELLLWLAFVRTNGIAKSYESAYFWHIEKVLYSLQTYVLVLGKTFADEGFAKLNTHQAHRKDDVKNADPHEL